MHISELRIRNFRNFTKARFRFQEGVNTLLGENGSGKTNAIYALRLLLDDALPRSAVNLRETDFSRPLSDWRGHWIVIAIDFDELDPSEGCQVLKHETGHMDESETGTYTLLFRPNQVVRKTLYEMSQNGSPPEEFSDYLGMLTIEDYDATLTGRSQADVLDDDTYAELVGDFENGDFPDPDDEDQARIGVRTPAIYPEISCTFAPALRDVISDLRRYRSNPLLALLRGAEANIQIEDAEAIVGRVTELNAEISSLQEIRSISSGIQDTLHATVGHTYSPTIGIESALPDNLEMLLQRLSVRVGDGADAEYQGDLSEQSLGGVNLIYLALKLLEYELKLSSDRVAHFLLIEEPEAHIHTHIQKTLFEKQAVHRTQVIVSSHSTHVSSAARIRSVNVLARKGSHAEVFQPASGLGDVAAQRVERYLDAVRSTLLFAKGVVLVEGAAEHILIPDMLRAVFGMSPDEMGISIISMDSAFFGHIAVVFGDDRIRRRCAIVTDHDQPFFDLPDDEDEDSEETKHARRAAKVGESRREALTEFAEGNPWVSPFLADHTFEVDFLMAGNGHEICEVINGLYTRKAAKSNAKEKIKDDDLAVSGREAIRLAKTHGKGWFALLLSEELGVNTYVPSYLLQAVAYAGTESLGPAALKRMVLHRVGHEDWSTDVKDALPSLEDLKGMPAQEVVDLYVDATDTDDLREFVGYLEEYTVG